MQTSRTRMSREFIEASTIAKPVAIVQIENRSRSSPFDKVI
jgi:hypothetical protein